MLKRAMVMAVLDRVASASQAAAQRVEVSGLIGWTLSDGVDGAGVLAADGNIYDAVDVKDSASWGFGLGFNATDNVEVGFLFGQQLSTMVLKGTAERELGDLNVNTYHPYVAFNAGTPDAPVRPYLMIGFGRHQLRQRGLHACQWHARLDHERDAVLDHLGRRRQGLRRIGRRLPGRHPVDAHLYQVGFRRLVVRPVLGLLRGG